MGAFPEDITRRAFDRQGGRCGLCGKPILWPLAESAGKGAWHAHHANGDDTDHRLENCVCLCLSKPRCNARAHEQDFGKNEILFDLDYPHRNG
jgi:hypothetical protein